MFRRLCETGAPKQGSNYKEEGAVSAIKPNIRLPITKSFLGINTTVIDVNKLTYSPLTMKDQKVTKYSIIEDEEAKNIYSSVQSKSSFGSN